MITKLRHPTQLIVSTGKVPPEIVSKREEKRMCDSSGMHRNKRKKNVHFRRWKLRNKRKSNVGLFARNMELRNPKKIGRTFQNSTETPHKTQSSFRTYRLFPHNILARKYWRNVVNPPFVTNLLSEQILLFHRHSDLVEPTLSFHKNK